MDTPERQDRPEAPVISVFEAKDFIYAQRDLIVGLLADLGITLSTDTSQGLSRTNRLLSRWIETFGHFARMLCEVDGVAPFTSAFGEFHARLARHIRAHLADACDADDVVVDMLGRAVVEQYESEVIDGRWYRSLTVGIPTPPRADGSPDDPSMRYESVMVERMPAPPQAEPVRSAPENAVA